MKTKTKIEFVPDKCGWEFSWRLYFWRIFIPLAIMLFFGISSVKADVLRVQDTDNMSGSLSKGGVAWSTARDNSIAGDLYVNNGYLGSFELADDSAYICYRLLWRFDGSALPDNATITGAVVKMRMGADSSFVNFYSVIVAAWDSSTTTHWNSSKYNEMYGWHSATTSWADSMAALSDSLLSGAVVAGDTVTYTLNAAGLAKISKTDVTQLYIIDTKDIYDVTPANTTTGYIEYEDVAFLEITYTLPTVTTNIGLKGRKDKVNLKPGGKW